MIHHLKIVGAWKVSLSYDFQIWRNRLLSTSVPGQAAPWSTLFPPSQALRCYLKRCQMHVVELLYSSCFVAVEWEIYPPWNKLQKHLKMDGWNTLFLLGWPIFRCYVSFRECTGFIARLWLSDCFRLAKGVYPVVCLCTWRYILEFDLPKSKMDDYLLWQMISWFWQ